MDRRDADEAKLVSMPTSKQSHVLNREKSIRLDRRHPYGSTNLRMMAILAIIPTSLSFNVTASLHEIN
ncbi:MAG: hypothetical protein WAT16_13555 [Saprospiraceae bacterium]